MPGIVALQLALVATNRTLDLGNLVRIFPFEQCHVFDLLTSSPYLRTTHCARLSPLDMLFKIINLAIAVENYSAAVTRETKFLHSAPALLDPRVAVSASPGVKAPRLMRHPAAPSGVPL
jgi:hypothetical protein